jgi:cation:H+ antiporter
MTTWLQLSLGLLLLLGSGEFLVRGAVGVARAFGVSPLFIGLTLVGFGTSTPELVASLMAAFRDAPGISVGNVVGSNIANILLTLGVTVLIAPVPIRRQAFHRDATALAGASLVALLVVLVGWIDRWAGLLMLATLAGYITLTYRAEKRAADAEARLRVAGAELHAPRPAGVWKPLLVAAAAFAGVILGARLLVESAIVIAGNAGISETVIGLTVVAVGTSLPELVVSVVAAFRGHGPLAVGNIVGSNIYNILFILGTTALARPIRVPPEIARADIWIMLIVTSALLAYMVRGRTMGRGIGALFLVGYSVYVWTLVR